MLKFIEEVIIPMAGVAFCAIYVFLWVMTW